jgi:hypothetical protein
MERYAAVAIGRSGFSTAPLARTSSSMRLTSASRDAAGVNVVKFSKSVNIDISTWDRTSATVDLSFE